MASTLEPSRAGNYPPGTASAAGRSLAVAVIDPVPIFRDGLSTLVHRTTGLHWAGHASNHHNALQLCEHARPDIVVVDSGLDPQCHLVRLLSGGDPALVIGVLVRDANRNTRFLASAIAAGMHAAIPRAAEPRRLLEGLRRGQLDRRYLDPSLATLAASPKRQQQTSYGAATTEHAHEARGGMPLSRREYQVLQLVAEGLENSAIAKILYLSVETVRTHVKSILRKLSARDRTHAVTAAFRSGILVAHPDDAAGQVRKASMPAAEPVS